MQNKKNDESDFNNIKTIKISKRKFIKKLIS